MNKYNIFMTVLCIFTCVSCVNTSNNVEDNICSTEQSIYALNKSGCCSHHGGVCGSICCDGTPLSPKCR